MRRALVAAAVATTLTACGSPTASSTSSSTTATSTAPSSSPASATGGQGTGTNALLPRPHVTVWPVKLPVGVGRAALIQHGSLITIAGGLVVGDGTTATAQTLDLAAGVPGKVIASLAVPVHDTAGATTARGLPMVIGGGNTSEQAVVQTYANGSWTKVGTLPATRSDLAAVTIGGVSYALGGYDGSTPAISSVLSTTDGSTWKPAGSLAVAVRYGAAAVSGGKVWIFGGEVSGAEKDVVQVYDPATGTGSVVTHLPTALGHMTAVAVQDRILLIGGRPDASSGAMSDRMWWFDPATSALTDAGRLPYPVADASAAFWMGSVWLIGGESPHPINTILKIQVIR